MYVHVPILVPHEVIKDFSFEFFTYKYDITTVRNVVWKMAAIF